MTKEQLKDYGLKVSQANATELVKLTLEIASVYVEDANKSVEDVTKFRNYISKARAFVGHLITSLNMDYDISKQLLNIYLFVNDELNKASIRIDTELLPRISGILKSLSEAFNEIIGEDKNGPVMENTQQVYTGLTYSKGGLNDNSYNYQSRGFTV